MIVKMLICAAAASAVGGGALVAHQVKEGQELIRQSANAVNQHSHPYTYCMAFDPLHQVMKEHVHECIGPTQQDLQLEGRRLRLHGSVTVHN